MPEILTRTFPIVGIGASAGGLKAIEKLLLQLPSNTNMAFIIVQHLSRRFKSLMKDILAKDTQMSVVMAEHEMEVKPNYVYLIPAGYELRIENSKLLLEGRKQDDSPHFVIDIFLHTLGQDVGPKSVAVILSGTGTDGSRGIRTVKENGGIVMVQDPKSGEFDGMPLSAIDTQVVDFVLPPEAIAEKLITLSKIGSKKFLAESVLAKPKNTEETQELITLTSIMELIKKYHDVDFSQYKLNTIRRRIDKQMATGQISSLARYYQFLLENPPRVEELFQELLIGVTEFFRDPQAYKTLEAVVFPKLVGENKHKEIRIWVCACSTGEEVYSLAIALHKYAAERRMHPQFTIIATDVNNQALAIASKGHYAPSKLSAISEEMLDTYFNYNGEKFEVKSFIRDNIIFARNDATADPPFINLDMISCRNFLIYLQQPMQRKLLLNFHFGLKSGAYMWLGASENVLDFKDNFNVLSEKWKVFQTWGETPKIRKYYSIRNPELKRGVPTYLGDPYRLGDRSPLRQTRFSYAKVLLDKFVPTSILIDDEFQILYLAGGAGKFLNLPDMEVSKDLLSMVSESMVVIIRDALRRLLTEEGPLLYPNVGLQGSLASEGPMYNIYIESIITPFEKSLFLIEYRSPDPDMKKSPSLSVIDSSVIQANSYEVIRDLQDELALAKQEVQNSLEELETSNEELQSANEELLASNEELQSTNEELQSVNEELYTVNSELQARNKELTDANATIDNLLANTEIGTLFLDERLQIKLFTPTFTQVINLSDNDIGTSVDKFSFKWEYPNFQEDLKEVRQTLEPIEQEVRAQNGNLHYLVRINPLLVQNRLEGLIILLIDITSRKEGELLLAETEKYHRQILDFLPLKVFILDKEGVIRFSNTEQSYANDQKLVGITYEDALKDSHKQKFLAAFSACKTDTATQSYHYIERSTEGKSQLFYAEIRTFQLEGERENSFMLSIINLAGNTLVNETEVEHIQLFNQITAAKETFISIKDEQFKYIYANCGFLHLLRKPYASVIGSNDFALFPSDIASQLRANDEKVLVESQTFSEIETLTHHDKTVKINSIKYLMVRNEQTYIIQIGTLLDFGMIQEKENGLPDAYIELENLVDQRTASLVKTNQQLRTLTRTMAHDLRGPLRAIYAFGEVLKIDFSQKLGERENDILTKMLRQSGQMAQIIDGLLSYLKLERVELQKEWIDVEAMVKEIWEDLQYLRTTDDFELIFRDTPALWADFTFTKQIFTNLLSNAMKYRHEDRKSIIEVGAFKENDENYFTYFIKDNGIGFEPADNKKIFEVFERLYEAKSKEGHGVGLSIVQKAMEIQGGHAWAKGDLGLGATFYLKFPASPEETESIS